MMSFHFEFRKIFLVGFSPSVWFDYAIHPVYTSLMYIPTDRPFSGKCATEFYFAWTFQGLFSNAMMALGFYQ